MFEEYYIEFVEVVDEIVECICILGVVVLGIYKLFVEFSLIEEVEGVFEVMEMVRLLIYGYE